MNSNTKSLISMIVAMDQNNGIGNKNQMPWHISTDLRWFKKNTLNKTVVMGSQTWTSIGSKPLPERVNIVLSRNPNLKIKGADLFSDYKKILELQADEICIIGGAQIYQLFMPYVKKIYLTRIWHQFEVDTHLTGMNLSEFKLIFEEYTPKDESNDFPMSFQIYQK